MTDQDRREALANDAARQSGYARGRADCAREPQTTDRHTGSGPTSVDQIAETIIEGTIGLSPEPTPGLREAIRDLYLSGIEDEPDYWGRTGGDPDARQAWLLQVVESWLPKFAALAASPAPEPTGLDAERLIVALRNVDERVAAADPENAVELLSAEAEVGRRDYAVVLAAEYARLTDSGATE